MDFVHKVSAKELRDGWTEGFVLDFAGDGVDILINDARVDSVAGKPFQHAPLKKGILGG